MNKYFRTGDAGFIPTCRVVILLLDSNVFCNTHTSFFLNVQNQYPNTQSASAVVATKMATYPCTPRRPRCRPCRSRYRRLRPRTSPPRRRPRPVALAVCRPRRRPATQTTRHTGPCRAWRSRRRQRSRTRVASTRTLIVAVVIRRLPPTVNRRLMCRA